MRALRQHGPPALGAAGAGRYPRWRVSGAMSQEIRMSKAERERRDRYEALGMSYAEGENRRMGRVAGSGDAQEQGRPEWRRMEPPPSDFFRAKQYDNYIDNFLQGGDLTPALSWDHFPHPLQLCRDLTDKAERGRGCRFSDKHMSAFVTAIAKRIGGAVHVGNADAAEYELQQAIELHRYATERVGPRRTPRHTFGKLSLTALMQCYVRAGEHEAALNVHTVAIAKDALSPKDPYAASVHITALCRSGRVGEAIAVFQKGWEDGRAGYVRMCGETLLTEVCRRRSNDGFHLCVRVKNLVVHADRAVPGSSDAVAAYIARGVAEGVPHKDLLEFLVDRLPYLPEYNVKRRRRDSHWDHFMTAMRGHPDLLVAMLAVAPPEFTEKPMNQVAAFLSCADVFSLPAAQRAGMLFYGKQKAADGSEAAAAEGDDHLHSTLHPARHPNPGPRRTATVALAKLLRACLDAGTSEHAAVGLTAYQCARDGGCRLDADTVALWKALARAALVRTKSLSEGTKALEAGQAKQDEEEDGGGTRDQQ